MKKIVFALCAESGGALSNLKEIYNRALNDDSSEWVFVLSTTKMEESKNVRVVYYPQMQRNWITRLFFGMMTCNRIIRKEKPDEIEYLDYYFRGRLDAKTKIITYATNALFFTPIKFKPSQSINLWLRQSLLRPIEYRTIRKADTVVVECAWMKKAIHDKLHVPDNKIIVKEHNLDFVFTNNNQYSSKRNAITTFFYPSSGYIYKNHSVIIEAARRMDRYDYEIVFTLKGDENKTIRMLKECSDSERLPIKWIGEIERKDVLKYLCESTLIFPSYLETIGLPLIEAREAKSPIICSDLPYARNVLKDYRNVIYVQYDNINGFRDAMNKQIDKKMES